MNPRLPLTLLTGALFLGLSAVPPGLAWELSGTSRTTLRSSWADAPSGEDDRAAYASEALSLEADRLPMDARVFLSGSYRWDIGQEDPDSVFYSSVDRFANGRHLFVQELGLSARPAQALEVTAGRFSWESAEPVHLDGAAARVSLPALPLLRGAELRAFGGRIVQFYEDLEKDGVYGAGVDLRLPLDVALTADYLDYFDDLTRVTARKAFGQAAYAEAGAEWVNGDLREASVSGTLWWAATGTEVTASVYKKIGNEDYDDFLLDFTADADPGRYELQRLALDRQAPYNQYRLGLEQRLGSVATVSLVYTKRDLIDEEHYESSFNTSFDVVQAGLGLFEPGVAGLSVRGHVSWWQEDRLAGDEARTLSYSLDAEQRLPRGFVVSGAYYRKTEDINNELESLVAQSLELGVGYHPGGAWGVDLAYTRETDDLLEDLYGVDEVHSVETRLTVRF